MKEDENDLSDAQQLRKKAEEQLKAQQDKGQASPTEMDAQRLIHELQVHQIELELQNEELQMAWERAETALKKYTVFFDFAPVAYFTLDRKAAICELNFAAAAMLGEGRLHLLGSNFKLFIAEHSRPAFNDFYQELYTNFSRESCEVTLVDRNDALIFAHLEGVVISEKDPCFLAVIDLSESH